MPKPKKPSAVTEIRPTAPATETPSGPEANLQETPEGGSHEHCTQFISGRPQTYRLPTGSTRTDN